MTTIDYSAIKNLKGRRPLHHQYPGQCQPQPAYIELDDGELTADWSGEIGNAVPAAVWHDRCLRWRVPPETSKKALLAFIRGNIELFERVAAGHSVEGDGSNHVGQLTEDAVAAQREIEYILYNGQGF